MGKKSGSRKMGALYKVPFRRRREHKTDYYARRRMLISRRLRAVVRKTNKYIIVQIVKATPTGDRTLISATSRELSKYGYNGSPSNIPAAYLTGLLAAAKAHGQISDAIADFGLYTVTPQSRLFAAIKGLLDGGISIPVDEAMLPSEERIKGQHVSEYAKMSPSGVMFTKSNADISKIFDTVVENIKKRAPRVKIDKEVTKFAEVAKSVIEEAPKELASIQQQKREITERTKKAVEQLVKEKMAKRTSRKTVKSEAEKAEKKSGEKKTKKEVKTDDEKVEKKSNKTEKTKAKRGEKE
ncbi:MAG: 50S ribosomal protein L18 [Candidatus Korarchaeota archaeon]